MVEPMVAPQPGGFFSALRSKGARLPPRYLPPFMFVPACIPANLREACANEMQNEGSMTVGNVGRTTSSHVPALANMQRLLMSGLTLETRSLSTLCTKIRSIGTFYLRGYVRLFRATYTDVCHMTRTRLPSRLGVSIARVYGAPRQADTHFIQVLLKSA